MTPPLQPHQVDQLDLTPGHIVANPAPAPRFQDMGIHFNLSPTVAAFVQINSTDGKGWTQQELQRLLAFLELQRSFLNDDPLDVHVTVTSPQPRRA